MISTYVFYLDNIIVDKKNIGVLISLNEPKIKVFDQTPASSHFHYLRPNGTITFSVGRKYNVPLFEMQFD